MKMTIAIFLFIREHIAMCGESPTYREIADGVGLKQANSVAAHLNRLEHMKLITREYGGDGKALRRSIQVTETGQTFRPGRQSRLKIKPGDVTGKLESFLDELEALLK